MKTIGWIEMPTSVSEILIGVSPEAVEERILGSLVYFDIRQGGSLLRILCQVTDVKVDTLFPDRRIESLVQTSTWRQVQLLWKEEDTGTDDVEDAEALPRGHGSSDEGFYTARLSVLAAFEKSVDGYRPGVLATVPRPGTPVFAVDDGVLRELLSAVKIPLSRLGTVYGSNVSLPMWFRHFGNGLTGAGEAYHTGIFGKTGSGKSVLARLITLSYARHPEMGIFVLDPQGEFSSSVRSNPFDMSGTLSVRVLKAIGREVKVYRLSDIRLNRWELFGEMLKRFRFVHYAGIRGASHGYHDEAIEAIVSRLRSQRVKLTQLDSLKAFRIALEAVVGVSDRLYSSQSKADRIRVSLMPVIDYVRQLEQISNVETVHANAELKDSSDMVAADAKTNENSAGSSGSGGVINPGPDTLALYRDLWDKWRRAAEFFTGNRMEPSRIIAESLAGDRRPLVIVDLSDKPEGISDVSFWEEEVKPLLIDTFVDELVRVAESVYRSHFGRLVNALVVIDEAHRIAPREKPEGHSERVRENKEKLRRRLIDAVRTTRKYGLGWLFISQTLASLHKEIINQMRMLFVGYGLNTGTEFQVLRELVGDGAVLDLYRSFKDPHSAFGIEDREYSFLVLGPVSPLSFSGKPMLLSVYTDPGVFYKANDIEIADVRAETEDVLVEHKLKDRPTGSESGSSVDRLIIVDNFANDSDVFSDPFDSPEFKDLDDSDDFVFEDLEPEDLDLDSYEDPDG